MRAPWGKPSFKDVVSRILGEVVEGHSKDPSDEVLDEYLPRLMDDIRGRAMIYVNLLYWYLRQRENTLRYLPELYELAAACGDEVQNDLWIWCSEDQNAETKDKRTAAYWAAAETLLLRGCGPTTQERKLWVSQVICGLELHEPRRFGQQHPRRLLIHYLERRARLQLEYHDPQARLKALLGEVPGVDPIKRMSEITAELDAIPLP
jgi:hypothetical protein